MAAAILASVVGCKNEPDTDTSAPDEVGGLEIKAADGNAVLTWTNPGDSDFDGIRISLNPAEGTLENAVILEKTAKSFSVSGLETGKTYTFTIQTFDTNRNYSEGTKKEVSVESSKDTVPPAEVSELKAEALDQRVKLTWKDPEDEDLFEVEISYSAADESQEKAKRASIVPKGAECAYISGLRNKTEYTFTATAIDLSGNKSQGQSIKAMPETSETGSPMKIELEKSKVTLNSDGTQQVTITANIKTESEITKVRYIKGSSGPLGITTELENSSILDDANMYYDERIWDEESQTEKLTGKKIQQIWDLEKDTYNTGKYTFTITADPKKFGERGEYAGYYATENANTTYRIVALDAMGRQDTCSIKITGFDCILPENFDALFKYENKKISVSPYTYSSETVSPYSFYDEVELKNATISYCKKGTDTAIKTGTFTPAPEDPRYIRNVVFTTDELEKDSQYIFTITATDHFENKRTLTFERSGKKYELGDRILKDGSTASRRNKDGISNIYYNDDDDNPTIATVAYIENGKAYAITPGQGLKNLTSSEYLTSSYSYMDKNAIEAIQCTPDKTSVSLSDESTDITFTGDTDGSDNWSEICKADTTAEQNAESNYPAFYYANNLATLNSNYANFSGGWYIPSMAELHKIFLSSKQTGITTSTLFGDVWTSNQATTKGTYSRSGYEAWTAKIYNSELTFEKEEMGEYNDLYLIRKFTEE